MSRFGRRLSAVTAVAVVFASAVLLSRGQGPTPTPAAPVVPPPAGSKFVIAPYLQYPTQTSITVMWETVVPGNSVVEFGLTDKTMKKVEVAEEVAIHEVKLTDLAPETKYAYRVSSTA